MTMELIVLYLICMLIMILLLGLVRLMPGESLVSKQEQIMRCTAIVLLAPFVLIIGFAKIFLEELFT